MVSFERESRWIRVNGILPKSLGESDSRPTSDPVICKKPKNKSSANNGPLYIYSKKNTTWGCSV